MKNKLVSVIIPVYNAEKYLAETLESVTSQKYTNWECVLVDDGSTDASMKIINQYTAKDDRIKNCRQKNFGASSARNRGFELSSGEYIHFLDADDVILPDYLEIMVAQSEMAEESTILYSNMLLGDHNNIRKTTKFGFPVSLGYDLTFDDIYRNYGKDIAFIPSCLLFPRKTINNIRWNEELGPSEDWDYFLEVLNKDYIFRFISEPLIIYRNTPDSFSTKYERLHETNYKVLSYWIKRPNYLHFTKRCAYSYYRSILRFITKQSGRIVRPKFNFQNTTFCIYLYVFLIYPYTLRYLLTSFISIIQRRFHNFLSKYI